MKKLLTLALAALLLPAIIEATTNYYFDGNFTFDNISSDNNSLILGSGHFEVVPLSSNSIDVTIWEFTSFRASFITNASAHVRITDGVFKVYNDTGYLLLLNGTIVNSTTAANDTIEFDVSAGNYTIKNGTVGSDDPPGSGGGSSNPKTTSAFKGRLNVLTSGTMADAIKELKLEARRFCRVKRQMAAVFAVAGWKTGDYPAPESDISAVLTSPIIDIDEDIYETSASEVLKAWSSSDTVVIARGDLEVDSMAAIAYARVSDVPILLTEPGELPSVTLDAVKKLNTRRFIIVGGEEAVSSEVAEALAGLGSVKRIAGANRQETAVNIAKALEKLKDIDTIVIADGERPSMDTAIIAAGYDAPVLYVTGDVVPQSTMDFVKAHRVTKKGKAVRLVFADVSGYIINYRLDKDF
ncbi:MAG: cell wall-binding repeat-containing protein [Candidatus Hydrothermarchaeaceae archaeon]